MVETRVRKVPSERQKGEREREREKVAE